MTLIQKQRLQTGFFVSAFAAGMGLLGLRRIQYLPGISKNGLITSTFIGVAPVILNGVFSQKEETDKIRRIYIVAGIVLGGVLS